MDEEVKIGFRDRLLMNVPLKQKLLLGFYGALIGFIAQFFLVSQFVTDHTSHTLQQALKSTSMTIDTVPLQSKDEIVKLVTKLSTDNYQLSWNPGQRSGENQIYIERYQHTLSVTANKPLSLVTDLQSNTLIIAAVFIAIVFVLASSVSANLLPLIDYIIDVMKVIASGRLDRKVGFSGDDEFGQLGGAIDRTLGNLSELILLMGKTTHTLNDTVQNIAAQSQTASDALDNENQNIRAVTQSMNAMIQNIDQVVEHTQEASSLAKQSKDRSDHVKGSVINAVNAIQKLSNDVNDASEATQGLKNNSEKIGSMVEVINSISEQTNLLALNAAIEAARAGDQGRGFAVVADEVRQLAQRTQSATVEIQTMIEELQSDSNQVSSFMGKSVDNAQEGLEQVGSAITELETINDGVDNIAQLNNDISQSMLAQSRSANDINDNLQRVLDLAQGSHTQMQSILEGNQAMEDIAGSLTHTLKKYSGTVT